MNASRPLHLFVSDSEDSPHAGVDNGAVGVSFIVQYGSRQDDVWMTSCENVGPGIAGQLVALMSRLTVRPALTLGSAVLNFRLS